MLSVLMLLMLMLMMAAAPVFFFMLRPQIEPLAIGPDMAVQTEPVDGRVAVAAMRQGCACQCWQQGEAERQECRNSFHCASFEMVARHARLPGTPSRLLKKLRGLPLSSPPCKALQGWMGSVSA